MSRTKLYLDLDGVLAEFHDSAFRFFGREISRPRRYNIAKSLDMESDELWKALDYNFWANLPWTHEGEELFAEVKKLLPLENIFILTSPTWAEGCMSGKADWVKKHLGTEVASRLMLTSAKHGVAGPHKVLVDDLDTNTTGFSREGGKTVLIPRQWNTRKHETINDGHFDLNKILEEVKKAV